MKGAGKSFGRLPPRNVVVPSLAGPAMVRIQTKTTTVDGVSHYIGLQVIRNV